MDRPPQPTLPQVDPLHPLTSLIWRECQRTPVGMWDAQAVVQGGKVYVGGGDVFASGYCLYMSDLMMRTWKTIKCPTRRPALTVYQERLVLVGGWDPSTATPTNQLWVMVKAGTWTQPLPPMPTPRWGATAATIQNNLIVAGGQGSREKLGVVEVYNGRQWATAQSLPRACCDIKSAIRDGNWYLVGGWGQGRDVFCASLESVVASTQSEVTETVWKTLPEVRDESSSTAVWGGRLMAVGGGPSCDILSYSPHTQSWVKVGDLPVGLSSTCAIVLPTGEMLVVGGWTGSPSDRVFKGSLRGLGAEGKEQGGGSEEDTKPGAGVKEEVGVAKWEGGAEKEPLKMKQERDLAEAVRILEESVAKGEKQLVQCDETIRMFKERHQKQLQQMESVMAENEQLKKQIRPVEEGALVPAGESTASGCLRGVDVIGETSLSVTNEAQLFHWAGYGLKLHIPPASLPTGVGQSSIDIKASLAGQFNFPENTTVVSAVYRLHSQVEFSPPISVEIQHCATPSDDPSLTFALASKEEPPYQFTALEGGLFPADSCYACIQLNRFSLVAILQKLWTLLTSRQPERQYCAQVYYTRETESTWRVHFVVTHNLEACITTVRERYSEALAGPELDVIFEDEEIVLQLPNKGVTINDNWTIAPLAYPRVAKKLVDSFESGGRLPSCQLRIKKRGKGRLEDLEYMVRLKGAKEPSDFFLIALECESTPKDVSPPPERTSVRSRQLYTSGISDDTVGPSTARDEDVSPPVSRSSSKRRHDRTSVEGSREKGREEGLRSREEGLRSREGAESDAGPSMPKRPKQSRGKDLTLKYPTGMESEPELSDLMDEVAAHIPDRWRGVGIALGLTINDLECFSVATTGDPSRCFCSVLTLWRSRMTREPYSWGTVVQALRAPAVGELRLAEQLENRLTKPN